MSNTWLESRIAALLRAWQGFKLSHPRLALVLAPLLRRLWEFALLRRASWARLAPPQSWQGQRDHEAMPTIAAATDPTQVVEDPEAQVAARVEFAFAVPGIGALLLGWIFDPHGRVATVRARAGAAESGNLRDQLVRFSRPDVTDAYHHWSPISRHRRPGFAGLARLDGSSTEDIIGSLELHFDDVDGRSWVMAPRPVTYDASSPLATIRTILSVIPPRDVAVLDDIVGPAVSALWSPQAADDWSIEDIGPPVAEPAVSIVVPVYGRYDFIEYQLAAFAGDPDFADAELIYVIDDPEITDDVRRLCRSSQPLFRIGHRLVLCESNNGFAGATNIGARVARGSVLLLLNSDVVPTRHGWLGAMLAAHAALPDDGVLGARLLFHDGSLQHDGMRFAEEAWFPGIWLNQHPGKGLPPTRQLTKEPARVDAVTAACMMVSRARYEEVGGLDEGYIIGDFEDSDLCLKLREGGHDSYVAPWIELYHLERQSQALDGDRQWRQSLTLYNGWRHTQKWSHLLGDPHESTAHG